MVDPEPKSDSRAIVFMLIRARVEEVAGYPNADSPIIKTTIVICRGTDKGGRKGYPQR